jgi:hypothetical protein
MYEPKKRNHYDGKVYILTNGPTSLLQHYSVSSKRTKWNCVYWEKKQAGLVWQQWHYDSGYKTATH